MLVSILNVRLGVIVGFLCFLVWKLFSCDLKIFNKVVELVDMEVSLVVFFFLNFVVCCELKYFLGFWMVRGIKDELGGFWRFFIFVILMIFFVLCLLVFWFVILLVVDWGVDKCRMERIISMIEMEDF